MPKLRAQRFEIPEKRLGLQGHVLDAREDIRIFKIGKANYVTRREAARIKAEHEQKAAIEKRRKAK